MDRYWVGGAGTWDATTTTNWATTSGGAGGASAPTFEDNVIFDSASNATAYTVTVGANAVCADFTAAGPLVGNVTFSAGPTSVINCHGSFLFPATGLTWTSNAGSKVNFLSTTTGNTLTTNGVGFANSALSFNGVGGAWTFGSAVSASGAFSLVAGTLDTGNFNFTTGSGFVLSGTNTRALILGSSTFTQSSSQTFPLSGVSGLTIDFGTSTIVMSGASPTLSGNGNTFYNVSFTSAAAGTATINGANTFNDLTFTSRGAAGIRFVALGDNQTVSGTLTLGAANSSTARMGIRSSVIGTQRTITLNGTLATLSDVDFRNINAAGTVSTPWTGTRLGDELGNSNITFDAAKTVYWSLAAGGSWTASAWATTSGGTPNINNFPLAQDTAIIEDTGLNSGATITAVASYAVGDIDFSTRTNPVTFAQSTATLSFYKNLTLSSAVTFTGTGTLFFNGQGTTQTITSAGVTFTQPITINSPTGTVQLLDNLTSSNTVAAGTGSSAAGAFALVSGTLDLNEFTLTLTDGGIGAIGTSGLRTIDFGSAGKIVLQGNSKTLATIASTTIVGTSNVELTYAGSTGTRTVVTPSAEADESKLINLYVKAGSDIFSTLNASREFKTLDFTGFTGTWSDIICWIYNNLVLGSGMTVAAGANAINFRATSGTQQVTSNNLTIDRPITQNGVGGTVQLQDNLTMGSTRAFTLTNGTLDLNDKVLTAGSVSTSNSNTRSIDFGRNGVINCEGAFTATTATGLTTAGRGRIKMSSTSAKTFAGGGANYSAATLEQAGAGTLTITGANTFDDITNSNATASQITFPANTTTLVRKLSVSGSSGNLVSLRSSTDGTKFTIQTV
jgi:fibronectin-binding autotransporter adhesin